ncbi:TPA: hypothetical protein ACH4Y7_004488 [Escherichia coli]|nr:hypothetical protein [Escherichia coli]EHS7063677.1 hypothetical protein [Escherichia coli]EJD4287933.1 hypothetical protein [Escherichia coli]EJU4853252.1 hypothetical protein [Escherichia coli]EKK3373155.1 hypothetical protein [Escherichia coli]
MLARTVKPSVLDIPHWGKSWLHPSHLRTDNATLRWRLHSCIAVMMIQPTSQISTATTE